MPFVSTYGTYSVRGFGALGSGPDRLFPAYIGYIPAGSYLYDIILVNRQLIGIYDTLYDTQAPMLGGRYIFKYNKYNQNIFWTENTDTRTRSLSYNNGTIYGCGTGGFYGSGITERGAVYNLGEGNAVTGRYYTNVDTVTELIKSTVSSDGQYVYSITNESSDYFVVAGNDGIITNQYLLGDLNDIDKDSVVTNISYGIIDIPSLTYTLDFYTGTEIKKVFDAGTHAYVATQVNQFGYSYLGIARINKTTFQLDYSYSFTTQASTLTGFTVDVANNQMYVLYDTPSETNRTRVTKFNLSGIPQWTRGFSVGGSKKILANKYYFYVLTNSLILEFPPDGTVPAGGVYVVDGSTYVYNASGTQWTNGTQNRLQWANFQQTLSLSNVAQDLTTISPTSTPSTVQLTWNGIG